jgi:hypothetical protein
MMWRRVRGSRGCGTDRLRDTHSRRRHDDEMMGVDDGISPVRDQRPAASDVESADTHTPHSSNEDAALKVVNAQHTASMMLRLTIHVQSDGIALVLIVCNENRVTGSNGSVTSQSRFNRTHGLFQQIVDAQVSGVAHMCAMIVMQQMHQ